MGQSGMTFAAWCSAVAVVFVVAPGIAAAADLAPEAPPPPAVAPATYAPPAPDWVVTVGAEVRAIPAWPGAPTTEYGLTGFPLFALQKPGDPPFFFGARDGFGVPILDFGQLQLGPVGKLVWPRYASSYSQLNGLGDVPWAAQIGGYAAYWPVPWLRVRGEIRQGIGGETGVSGDLFADVVVPFGQWRLSGGSAPVAAIDRCGFSVFQYYSSAVRRLRASRLQCDRRVLFLRRGRSDRVFL